MSNLNNNASYANSDNTSQLANFDMFDLEKYVNKDELDLLVSVEEICKDFDSIFDAIAAN